MNLLVLIFFCLYIAVLFVSAGSNLLTFRLEPYHAQIIALVVVMDLIIELLCLIHGVKRNLLYNFVALCEFWLYTYYYLQIIHSKSVRIMMLWSLWGLPIVWFILVFGVTGVTIWNTNFHAIGSVLVVLWSACYYYQLFTAERLQRLGVSFEFWVATAMIVYYSCDAPFLLLLNYLSLRSLKHASRMMAGLLMLNVVYYSIISYAFICLRRQRKLSSL